MTTDNEALKLAEGRSMKIKILVPVSGGKDSQASLKLALQTYRPDEVLDMVLRLESPDEYDYMVVLSSDIRRMKKGE